MSEPQTSPKWHDSRDPSDLEQPNGQPICYECGAQGDRVVPFARMLPATVSRVEYRAALKIDPPGTFVRYEIPVVGAADGRDHGLVWCPNPAGTWQSMRLSQQKAMCRQIWHCEQECAAPPQERASPLRCVCGCESEDAQLRETSNATAADAPPALIYFRQFAFVNAPRQPAAGFYAKHHLTVRCHGCGIFGTHDAVDGERPTHTMDGRGRHVCLDRCASKSFIDRALPSPLLDAASVKSSGQPRKRSKPASSVTKPKTKMAATTTMTPVVNKALW